jgi:hypothetical protein
MSLDLTTLIESAADEVASAGRAAAGSINELVHDWGHETRTFVSEHAPSLPGRHAKRSSGMSMVRLLLPVAVLAVVAYVLMHRRGKATPHLPERQHVQDEVRETVVASAPDKSSAKGAAAS